MLRLSVMRASDRRVRHGVRRELDHRHSRLDYMTRLGVMSALDQRVRHGARSELDR